MSERQSQTTVTGETRACRPEAAEPLAAAGHDHARRLEEVKSELDTFAAEVLCELASIRDLLSPIPAHHSFQDREETTRSEPSEAASRQAQRTPDSPSIVRDGGASAPLPCSNSSDSGVNVRPEERLSRLDETPAAAQAALTCGEQANGHDRLAALKMRLAAKLQADGNRRTWVEPAAVTTSDSMLLEGTDS